MSFPTPFEVSSSSFWVIVSLVSPMLFQSWHDDKSHLRMAANKTSAFLYWGYREVCKAAVRCVLVIGCVTFQLWVTASPPILSSGQKLLSGCKSWIQEKQLMLFLEALLTSIHTARMLTRPRAGQDHRWLVWRTTIPQAQDAFWYK